LTLDVKKSNSDSKCDDSWCRKLRPKWHDLRCFFFFLKCQILWVPKEKQLKKKSTPNPLKTLFHSLLHCLNYFSIYFVITFAWRVTQFRVEKSYNICQQILKNSYSHIASESSLLLLETLVTPDNLMYSLPTISPWAGDIVSRAI
jgi:hypothetical protein